MLRGDDALVSIQLRSQASLELRVYGVLRSYLRPFYQAPPYGHAFDAIRRPPRRGGGTTLKRVGRSLQPMCSGRRYCSASTPGRREPLPTPFRAGATLSPPQREKAPTTRCGAEKWEVSVKLLDPPRDKPNTRVGEADLISHRSADVQVAPIHVRPAVDDRDVVCTPSCVAHRKLGSKRQGTVRRTPRRGRHHLARGRVGSWHRVPGGIPRLGFCLVSGQTYRKNERYERAQH